LPPFIGQARSAQDAADLTIPGAFATVLEVEVDVIVEAVEVVTVPCKCTSAQHRTAAASSLSFRQNLTGALEPPLLTAQWLLKPQELLDHTRSELTWQLGAKICPEVSSFWTHNRAPTELQRASA